MIALFGIGQLGSSLYRQLKLQNIKVDFLLDNHKKGQFDEFIIKTPNDIEFKVRTETTVIISTFKQELSVDELNNIRSNLIQMGFKKVLNLQECINEFNLNFEYFYLGKLGDDKSKIEEVHNFLSDDLSKQIYKSHLDFRVNGDIKLLHNNLSSDDQYFPDFFVSYLKSLDKGLTIVDCGACFGDLFLMANKKSIVINNYFAFEPDINNRITLTKNIIDYNIKSVVLPVGVGEIEQDLRFKTGDGMGSCFDPNGDTLVKVVNLDSCIFEKIDFIKMDIEGFEAEALSGGSNIVKLQNPALAISIYHKPNDIFELPFMLKKYYKNFYIRQHGRYGFDLVLYCFN